MSIIYVLRQGHKGQRVRGPQLTPMNSEKNSEKNARGILRAGRFQRPSERVPFSDEGGFVFSKAPFKGTLHEGLKGASPSEGFKGA